MQRICAKEVHGTNKHSTTHSIVPPEYDVEYHPTIRETIREYAAREEMLHTLFYGPSGSGKMTIVRYLIAQHMKVPDLVVQRTQMHTYQIKEREFPFYKTQVHFELNVADFSPSRQNALMDLLQDLAKTLNVSRNCCKLIVVRNVELLHRSVQHQLRRMMELFYDTCRLIFVCHTLDCLDITLQSRFVCVRVPIPECLTGDSASINTDDSPMTVSQWLSNRIKTQGIPDIQEHIQDQLWTVLHRKTFPVTLIRKWIRIVTMTHLPLVDILMHLYRRLVTKYPKHLDFHKQLYEISNACMHLYAIGYRKEFQPELLLCHMYMLIQKAKKN